MALPLQDQPYPLQPGAAHEVVGHIPSRLTVNTLLLPPHTPLPLPNELVETLHRSNPWWRGDPTPPVPATRRHLVGQVRQRLERGITPIVAAPGPRGVGKTTMQLQMIDDLLAEGVPPHHIIRVPLDEVTVTEDMFNPILRITSWVERNVTPATFNALAHQGQTAYLFFDEVQHISNWSNQLKFLVDHSAVKVVATGNSALRIEQGRDSLAGRTPPSRPALCHSPKSPNFGAWRPSHISRPKKASGSSTDWCSGKSWPNTDGEMRKLATRPSSCTRNAAATLWPRTRANQPPIGRPSAII